MKTFKWIRQRSGNYCHWDYIAMVKVDGRWKAVAWIAKELEPWSKDKGRGAWKWMVGAGNGTTDIDPWDKRTKATFWTENHSTDDWWKKIKWFPTMEKAKAHVEYLCRKLPNNRLHEVHICRDCGKKWEATL